MNHKKSENQAPRFRRRMRGLGETGGEYEINQLGETGAQAPDAPYL